MNKKTALVSLSLLVLSAFILHAQQNAFIGYDKVSWGTSYEDVQKKYPNIIEITKEDEKALGITTYSETNVSELISMRAFTFYNNALYMVSVGYSNTDVITYNAIFHKLTDIYGEFDDSEEINTLGEDGSYYIKGISLFRYYSKNLTIKLVGIDYINDENDCLIKSDIYCYYADSSIDTIVENNKLNSKKNKIEL
jgi:hypothetical protein